MRRKHLMTIITAIHDTIPSIEFLNSFRVSEKDFTRKRKMTFVGIITFITNFLSKSLQAELDHYFKFNKLTGYISQQAISKARQKIKPEAFKYLFDITVKGALEDPDISRYKGYRVFAIDGTEIHLEPTKELIETYGQKPHNQNCKAKVSILCEVNEGIIIDACMDTYAIGERELAIRHIEAFEPYKQTKDLIIFDRGYPSKQLLSLLDQKKIKYLMRVQKSFNKEIDENNQEDFYQTLQYQGVSFKVRVIKLELDTGEIETLITNLGRKAFKKKEFKELYFKRWPVETRYNTLKNKLRIENFSGRTKISIQQDFYATMYLANIVTITKIITDEEIDQKTNKRTNDKKLKNEYQTNESMLISKLKDDLVLCLLIDDPEKRAQAMDQIIFEASRSRSSIRENRSFERKNIDKNKKTIKRRIKNNH